ncbi:MAG: DUF1385 domain-containing protein [Polyangiaceae bacterium]
MIQSSSSSAEETPNPTNVGGQAVIEGVMMRAPGSLAVVVRRRNGSLVVRERTVVAPTSKTARLPFIRGVHTLVSSLKLGHQALRFSADIMEEDFEDEEDPPKKPPTSKVGTQITLAFMALTQWLESAPRDDEGSTDDEESPSLGRAILGALPFLVAIGVFIALPQLAAEGINSLFKLNLPVTSAPFQAITGLAKLTILVSYFGLLRANSMIRRVFQYHGAEHKAISTYENRRELLVENARETTALHARCGTTFIIMVAFVSVVLFSAMGALMPPIQGPRVVQSLVFFILKLPLLPVVAAITFEIQRLFARYCLTGPLRFLLWPGFLVQKITTAPPDDAQLEVALASLRSALTRASVPVPATHPDRTYESYARLVDDPAYRVA